MSTTAPRRWQSDVLTVVAGMIVAGLGLVIQWIARPATFASFGFPPGLIYVLGTAAIVWSSRRSPFTGTAGVTMGIWILLGGLVGGDLQTNLASGQLGVVVGNAVMAGGLALSLIAGAFSIAIARRIRPRSEYRPVSKENPRRVAAIIAIGGLVADSIGDAAPEGFRWDGLGPLLFLALAIAVSLTPGPAMMRMSVLICFCFLGAALSSTEMMDAFSQPVLTREFIGAALQIGGLGIAFLAGLFAAIPTKTRQHQPVSA